MMPIDVHVASEIVNTPRVLQLSGLFDVPPAKKIEHAWKGEVPIDEKPWNIGLIVGPSGAGKSTIKRQLFGEEPVYEWAAASVVDDFNKGLSMQGIASVCSAVGFNTIPSWTKPYAVLSTGEKFRVELARALVEGADPVVVDEFTSVVDRQVAKIGSHAVQKFVRGSKSQFVAVTCHYDVVDWLQPDWVLEPATMVFQWRSVQRRPQLNGEVARVEYEAWKLFAHFHYMSAELNHSAKCFALFVDGVIASFGAVLPRPHPTAKDIYGLSRLVTLPDYQGLGLAMILADKLGAAYRSIGKRFHTYPAHPSLIRSFDRSPRWSLRRKPSFSSRQGPSTTVGGGFGGRPCAVFEYIGERMAPHADAVRLLA